MHFIKERLRQTIADIMEEQGGFLTYEDLGPPSSQWVEPLSTPYRGY